jgi:acetylornithine deacetylase/succinyl-diaminopimelate desuccinylase-like protein
MLERLVAFRSFAGSGEQPALAEHLAGEFRAAGFPAGDVELVRVGDAAALLVWYRGTGSPERRPVVFLAHLDVVPALKEAWRYDPWQVTEVDGLLYGRGVVDNKYGVLTMTRAFLRLKREGFVPDRDLVLAFTGDEETSMATTRALAERLRDAAFAINADTGGGFRPARGVPSYLLQVAEKTYATFEIVARSEGGHSARPTADNAIYALAAALQKLAAHRFPAQWSEATLAGFAATARTLEGPLADALTRFVESPGDPEALRRIEQESWLDVDLRTTCVATMLRAGQAENALPTSATATVNCRILPGVPAAEVAATLRRVIADDALAVRPIGEVWEAPASVPTDELRQALQRLLAVREPSAVVIPYMEAGATDAVHFRRAGIPTFGVGPLFSTEGIDYNFHANDERLPVDQFHDGLDHYYVLMRALADGASGKPRPATP